MMSAALTPPFLAHRHGPPMQMKTTSGELTTTIANTTGQARDSMPPSTLTFAGFKRRRDDDASKFAPPPKRQATLSTVTSVSLAFLIRDKFLPSNVRPGEGDNPLYDTIQIPAAAPPSSDFANHDNSA